MGWRQRRAAMRAAVPLEQRRAIGRRALREAAIATLGILGFCFAASTFVFAMSGFRQTGEYGRTLLVMALVQAPLVYGVAFMHAVGRGFERAGFPVESPSGERETP